MATREGRGILDIHASSNAEDKILLQLPTISRDSLGLSDYDVTEHNLLKTTIYSEDYLNQLRAWEAHPSTTTRTQVGTRTEKYRPYLGTRTIYLPTGETRVEGVYGDEVEREVAVYEYTTVNHPRPVPGPDDIKGYEYSYATIPQLEILDAALKKVVSVRSKFGAEQNRLEHAYKINKNSEENSQASESRIRDTDMAKEVVANARYNILTQAGQAILAQANQQPNGVLSLLR